MSVILRGCWVHSLLIEFFLEIVEYLETLLEKLSVLLELVPGLLPLLASTCRPIQVEDAELIEHGDVLLEFI